jgi:hypothetical protein
VKRRIIIGGIIIFLIGFSSGARERPIRHFGKPIKEYCIPCTGHLPGKVTHVPRLKK